MDQTGPSLFVARPPCHSRYPLATRLYLVLDNFSPHKRREVTDWAADHNVELVFTPTYASWLNRIEAIFSGVRYFALANSDYPDHAHSRRAILAYVAGATGIATPSSSNAGKNTRCFSLRGTRSSTAAYGLLVRVGCPACHIDSATACTGGDRPG